MTTLVRAEEQRDDDSLDGLGARVAQLEALHGERAAEVRTLFRDVAKTIHPDLADDDVTRDRRHALMIEANRAYARGDEDQLRWILQAWERSPESVRGSDPEAMRVRLVRRIGQIEERLTVLANELDDLKDSPLWELKVVVDQAAIRGKDIVADMVQRLKRDIMAATNRLDAMRPPGQA